MIHTTAEGSPSYSALPVFDRYGNEYLRRIAVVNIKKSNGAPDSDMQEILTAIKDAELARDKALKEAEIAHAKELAEIEKDKQKAYADTVEQMVKAISPDLVAALTTSANADLLTTGMQSMSPYTIANGESVSDTVNKLLRGTPLEGMLEKMVAAKSE